MKTFVMIVCLLLSNIAFALDVIQAHANGGKFYDAQGRYQVRVDSNGKQYDVNGRYMGKVDSNGKVYDKNGRLKGTWR